mgnify:CR=1 FL=1
MTPSFQERRTRPRLEPPRELYVEADLGPDQCTTAQVLDSSGNGMRLLSTVLGTDSMKSREDASAALLNYGFFSSAGPSFF